MSPATTPAAETAASITANLVRAAVFATDNAAHADALGVETYKAVFSGLETVRPTLRHAAEVFAFTRAAVLADAAVGLEQDERSTWRPTSVGGAS